MPISRLAPDVLSVSQMADIFPDGFSTSLMADISLFSAEKIGLLAVQAAILEASTPHKPGLVCYNTNGAHKDMTIHTLVASALSLKEYFENATKLGITACCEEPNLVFGQLRPLGCDAEKAMFSATNGINTHKGLVFSLGLFCTALGKLYAMKAPWSPETITMEASRFVQGIVATDLGPLLKIHGAFDRYQDDWERYLTQAKETLKRPLSAGETLFLRYGSTGIRGEAEQGFPHVLIGVHALKYWLSITSFDNAVVNTLLTLMTNMDDTNILWRGGQDGLAVVQSEAQQALNAGGMTTLKGQELVASLEKTCLKLWLSPGGCADILAVVIFLYLVMPQWFSSDSA